MKKKYRNGLLFLFGIFVLWYLAYYIGYGEIVNSFKEFEILFLPLVVLSIFVTKFIFGLNIWILTRYYKKIKFLKVVKYGFFTMFFAPFFPAKISDLLMAFYLRKDKLESSQSFTLVFVDKIISLLLKIGLAFLAIFIFIDEFNVLVVLSPFILIFGLILFFYALKPSKIRSLFTKYILRKYAKNVEGFSDTFKDFLKENKKGIFYNFLISIPKVMSDAFLFYILFLSFGERTNFFIVLIMLSLLSIITFVAAPAGIFGIGTREAAFVIVFGLIGLDKAVVFNSAILRLVIVFTINLFTLMIYKGQINLLKKVDFVKNRS